MSMPAFTALVCLVAAESRALPKLNYAQLTAESLSTSTYDGTTTIQPTLKWVTLGNGTDCEMSMRSEVNGTIPGSPGSMVKSIVVHRDGQQTASYATWQSQTSDPFCTVTHHGADCSLAPGQDRPSNTSYRGVEKCPTPVKGDCDVWSVESAASADDQYWYFKANSLRFVGHVTKGAKFSHSIIYTTWDIKTEVSEKLFHVPTKWGCSETQLV
jgi:hypothetical protein